MRNKYIFAFLLIFILLPPTTNSVYAGDEENINFIADYNVLYDISADGTTDVTHNVSIENVKNDYVVSSYSILIRDYDIYDISGASRDRKVEVTKTDKDGIAVLTARFDDFIIGEGKKNVLDIKYTTNGIARMVGKIWNINIPKVSINNTIKSYNIGLKIPSILGPKLYISPEPESVDLGEQYTIYRYSKDSISEEGITASFGTFQEMNFRLLYQIKNDNWFTTNYEVAFPPEIKNSQQMKYSSIKPSPYKIRTDADGNAIAVYKLKPGQSEQVELIGNTRLRGQQIEPEKSGTFSQIPRDLNKYLSGDKFWNTESKSIRNQAQLLKDKDKTVAGNAKGVYDYIMSNYHYDFGISQNSYLGRKGGENALLNKEGWGCMEFTDLFISLSRAMGIPARQLNGYAINFEDTAKPMSILLSGGDKLHAWPEFYDPYYGWVQIDPTWGSTSGIDYFSKLDNSHVVFVVRGRHSEIPLSAGEYRLDNSRLVEVSYSDGASVSDFSPKFSVKSAITLNVLALLKGERLYKVTNDGGTFFYLENGTVVAPRTHRYVYRSKNNPHITLSDFVSNENTYYIGYDL